MLNFESTFNLSISDFLKGIAKFDSRILFQHSHNKEENAYGFK